jgi:hypothetical protein
MQPFSYRTTRHLAALAIFAVLATLLFLYPRLSSSAVAGDPQKRRPQRGQRTGAQPARTGGSKSLTNFIHDDNHVKFKDATRKTANCDECHSVDEPWEYVIKDFPDHDKCLRCHQTHRVHFFNGNRPPICLVCHKSSSPREVRPRPFPKPNTEVTEFFPGYFPHGQHQDVIASHRAPFATETWSLLRASFSPPDEKPAKEIESCATCHDLNKEPGFFPVPVNDAQKSWPEGMKIEGTEKDAKGKEVKVLGGTFRDTPRGWDGHKTCFVCHAKTDNKGWTSQTPVANDCAGCHLSRTGGEGATTLQLPPTGDGKAGAKPSPPIKWVFTNAALPMRTVFKFQHEVSSHDIACTTCHTKITQQYTLNIPKPDVLISSCATCHLSGSNSKLWTKRVKVDGKDTDVDINITTEIEQFKKNKDPKQCIGCHLPDEAARKPIPCDHFNIFPPEKRTPPPGVVCAP